MRRWGDEAMRRWGRWHDEAMTRWGDEAMKQWWDEKMKSDGWLWTLNLELWTLKIDPRLSSFCYKDGLRPICLRHYPGLRPPLLKEGELRFGRAFQPWPAITNHKPLLLSFRFQVSGFKSPHLLISSSFHLLIFSSPHLLIFSSSHLFIFSSFHLIISSSPHLFISSSSHRLIASSSHRKKRAKIPLRPWLLIANC